MNLVEFKKDWSEKISVEDSPEAASVRGIARLYSAFPEPGALGLLEGAYDEWKKIQI